MTYFDACAVLPFGIPTNLLDGTHVGIHLPHGMEKSDVSLKFRTAVGMSKRNALRNMARGLCFIDCPLFVLSPGV